MADVHCPSCDLTTEPAVVVGAVTICGACGASLVVDETGVRRAMAADTTTLSPAALQTLQRARGRIARPDRRQR